MIQGSQRAQTLRLVCGFWSIGFGGGMVAAGFVAGRASAGEVQISFGCQTCRKQIRQAIETSDAPMSTIHGLMKFEIRNCGTANDTPHDEHRGPDLRACRASRRTPRSARTARSARRTAIAARPSRRADRDRGRSTREQARDRRAQRAEGDRRGVGDQRQAGGGERREAEADQDRARDRDRRAEAGGALEERAERRTRSAAAAAGGPS